MLSIIGKIRIYKTVTLPVVLYGYKTWSSALRKEHRLKVFENRVLKGIFGLKRDVVAGEWRKLHNEELRDLYSSPRIIGMAEEKKDWMFWTLLSWLGIGASGELS
jgi:hypothetical protein